MAASVLTSHVFGPAKLIFNAGGVGPAKFNIRTDPFAKCMHIYIYIYGINAGGHVKMDAVIYIYIYIYMTAYIYSYILEFVYSALPDGLPETFRIPSGTRAF